MKRKRTPWGGAHHALADETHCARCGRRLLTDGGANWLELNSHTGKYRDASMAEFPEGQSQGWFGFGRMCAALTIAEQSEEP